MSERRTTNRRANPARAGFSHAVGRSIPSARQGLTAPATAMHIAAAALGTGSKLTLEQTRTHSAIRCVAFSYIL